MSRDRIALSQAIREPTRDMGEAQRRIGDYLRKLRFKRALFGVSERDVWRRLAEVNELFQQALIAERARYEALLEAQGTSRNGLKNADGGGEEAMIE